jgi:hypothetical protein
MSSRLALLLGAALRDEAVGPVSLIGATAMHFCGVPGAQENG